MYKRVSQFLQSTLIIERSVVLWDVWESSRLVLVSRALFLCGALHLTCTSTEELKAAWEEDLGLSLSDLAPGLKYSNQFMHPPYVPAIVLSKASLLHISWLCPRLNKHWNKAFHTLSQAFQVKMQPNPWMGLFGVREGRIHLPNEEKSRIQAFPPFLMLYPPSQA